ncbi:hypothetical protein nbrc107697_03520 [Gordonia crocea]|uniref:Uncharacterized protein n=1 Tax=Gordonia crocea TaxID=589162 RepID=A0A7M3SUI9_9ACTN|nr:hypothetical protein nbrc107697_03520 [Gordonia crocea]
MPDEAGTIVEVSNWGIAPVRGMVAAIGPTVAAPEAVGASKVAAVTVLNRPMAIRVGITGRRIDRQRSPIARRG